MAAGGYLSKLTDEQVIETINKLKKIEERASAVCDTATQERSTFNSRVYAETERRKEHINKEANHEIEMIRKQSQQLVAEKSFKIEQECEDKKKTVSTSFAANRDAWQKTIYKNILAGI